MASILLIAFTLAVATIVGSWLTSMTRTGTETTETGFSAQVNCSKVVLDVVDALCHDNTNVTISISNIGSLSLTNPSFYIRTTDQTTCTENQTDTIDPGGISSYEINCTNFGTGKTLDFVRVSTICEGVVSVYGEKSNIADSC